MVVIMDSDTASFLTLEDGKKLVKIARSAIETYVKEGREAEVPKDLQEIFLKKRGVFVTIQSYPDEELRGCIGLPYPRKELVNAIIGSAISAATEDPRFQSIDESELDKIIIEISVLTVPEKINVKDPKDYLREIEIGRDGLIITLGWSTGLLLPQVPVEQGWNEEEFISNLCIKAGLPPDAWLGEGLEILKFQAQVFSEEKPAGPVIEKKLTKSK